MTNILLILLDSVRARNCSIYGHENETTPFLEEFAERATLYQHGHSPGAKSVTSHVSIFSGLHVLEHGVHSADSQLKPELSVFDRLQTEEGYDTAVFSENNWITSVDIGLKDGFDHVVGPQDLPFPEAPNPKAFVAEYGRGQYLDFIRHSFSDGRPGRTIMNGVATKLAADYPRFLPDFLKSTTPASIYTDEFLRWSADRSEPWAACINFMDGHIPYQPQEEHDLWGGKRLQNLHQNVEDHKWSFVGGARPVWQRRAFEALYDGTIHQMDAQLKRIVEELQQREELEDTLLVISSDHGEGFGEPSEIRPGIRCVEHGVSIHEVLTHVPLIVSYPGQTDEERVESPASLTEFPRVVTDAMEGLAEPGSFVPDGPVLTAAPPLDPALHERALRYVDDLEPFLSTARAAYVEDAEGVLKGVRWGDRAATLRVRDAQISYMTSFEDSIVEPAYQDIEERNVQGDRAEGIDTATERRLEDLGYL